VNGIEIGIDPTLAQLGPFALRWYSLFFTVCQLGPRRGLP